MQCAAQASYKPSPLSFNSPRTSPFRRPESPASPSPLRNSTNAPLNGPASSPSKQINTPSKLHSSTSTPSTDTWTPRGLAPVTTPRREPERSPTRGAESNPRSGAMLTDRFESQVRSSPLKTESSPQIGRPAYKSHSMSDANALSKLQPGQVRELREGFQILDRDSDGIVNREDVADMLTQLGLPASASDLSSFFPPSQSQTMTMATFLTQISTMLASLSPSDELLNAFAAFDDDDSGQVDLAELKDALLHTAPEAGEEMLTAREVDRIMGGFSGRRAFGKTMVAGKRGEVFKYQDFVTSVAGGNGKDSKEDRDD
ncbi:hypothetical protein V500_04372 [Pseudogymnoascus sp. VKM F-4518 (FW-2643)]|nr:hypothetical protein V500_04372 [Pseudogymnoascus sp. VKM F-4518 (FW-2643)]KFZ18128.1 hypothetical protein V502_04287 [Pseudogymnoascus sp. VKM F-4520 (FW-2644)]